MLTSLLIRDVVLIEALDIEAGAGLCALTGETGAGKSILLDSMGLALGMRGDSTLVRQGATQASVTATFELPARHPVFKFLKERDIEADDGLIFRRVLTNDGRSKAFINDQPVSITLLREAGDMLVDIHGQFETRGLLDPKTHRETLDQFAGADVAKTESAYRAWKDAKAERDALLEKIASAKRDQEYWQAACEELTELAPQENEEEQLLQRRVVLAAREQIASSFAEAKSLMDEDGGAIPQINRAWKTLDRVAAKAGDRLNPAIEALDRAVSEIRTAADILDTWFDADAGGPDTLEAVDDRLHALRAAARKHQCRADDLPKVLADISERLATIRGDDGRLAKLDHAVGETYKTYKVAAQALSDMRVKAAAKLDKLVMTELPPLKLDKARFETQVTALDESAWGPHGMDDVQFVVATNPGSAAGAINKIASGGELSRFMLAIKVVLAGTSSVPVLVFDEVDAGLGGATADAVGERLARLAKAGRQVLVVTHSPQVAARAGAHWVVSKAANDRGIVRTRLEKLDAGKPRQMEIARMISGATVTPEALAAAGKLLQQAS
ncbi:MAG: DNA repair protein RecN [Alphaproteobacteria bacterium]|nr:DNA repair protein RecN [Alphaproteobacteria bacterium]